MSDVEKIVIDQSNECVACGSSNLEDISHHFAHIVSDTEKHLMCKKCIIELTKVCTCSKEFKQEPKMLMVYCPCSLDKEPTKTYHSVNTGHFLELLEKWPSKDVNYFFIHGCNGCMYLEKEICSNYPIALRASVDACIYEKKDQGELCMMAYISDALDPEFVKYATSIGVDLGSCTDI